MSSLKGSKTEKNILTAFAGESQARNKYTFFSKQARNDGYVQIASIFEETAHHESQHAKQLFKQLQGGEVEITAAFPAGVIGSTLENLKAAAAGERHEYMEMYPTFAEVAKEEGFNEVALLMLNIAKAEEYHEKRYLGIARIIEENRLFRNDTKVVWKCRNCGFAHEGLEAPHACPACNHPQAHFELLMERW